MYGSDSALSDARSGIETGGRWEFRAVTAAHGDEWIVVDDHGDEVFRGHAIYAARVAAQLNARRV